MRDTIMKKLQLVTFALVLPFLAGPALAEDITVG
jgi:hypothetical protein